MHEESRPYFGTETEPERHTCPPPLNKEMILRALKRDQDKVLNPRTEPFTSVNNAYDSLLPYHIFLTPTYDDLIYQSVKRTTDYKDMTDSLNTLVDILLSPEDSSSELYVMEERLRVEEERYYLNKTAAYRNTKIKDVEERLIHR
ncbi:hypothetical protein NEDG_01285 [Nematocida displodere]|uniref:GLTSCR protein conserved domain-containing protein n=1 Tax=Nematocida displodere TaxID=1805483 RepID=A0A177EDH4_9MICR|nr:hypothetical protein NEDG_01285 [Nematocida displodere]